VNASDAQTSRWSNPKTSSADLFQNDDWSNGLRQYPKNTCASYDPPNLPAVAQCPDSIKAHDNQLSRIQCDIAHLTRPIDHLIHMVLTADDIPEDSEQVFINFANHMHGQLASLASKITRVRMENIRKNKGIPTSDNSNLLFDPQAFNEEIKTAKALAAAFAPPKSNSNSNSNNSNQGRGKSGKQDHSKQQSRGNQGRGNNSDGHGYDNRRNSDNQSDNENDRGRQRSSSFHRNKGKDTRRHSQSRGRSNSRKSSDRQ
jgi:hypothetical protein